MKGKIVFIAVLLAACLTSCRGCLAPVDFGYHAVLIRQDGKLYFQILDFRNENVTADTADSMRAYEKKTGKLVWYTGDLDSPSSIKLQQIPYGYLDPDYCFDTSYPDTTGECIALPLKKGKTYIMQARVPGHPAIPPEKLCPPLEFTP